MHHAICEEGSVLFAAKVKPPHLPVVPPLVEVRRSLVVFQPLHNWAVYHHLLVCLHLAAHHSEGVGGGVVVDLHPAEDLGPRAGWDPLLIGIVVYHHRGPRLTDARLTHC